MNSITYRRIWKLFFFSCKIHINASKMIKQIQRPRRNQFLAINNTIRSAPARQAAVWSLGFPSSTQSSHYIAAKIRVQLGGLLQNAGSSTHSSTRTSLQLIHHSQHKLTAPLRQSYITYHIPSYITTQSIYHKAVDI